MQPRLASNFQQSFYLSLLNARITGMSHQAYLTSPHTSTLSSAPRLSYQLHHGAHSVALPAYLTSPHASTLSSAPQMPSHPSHISCATQVRKVCSHLDFLPLSFLPLNCCRIKIISSWTDFTGHTGKGELMWQPETQEGDTSQGTRGGIQ